jgi:hypothetical protein
VELVQGMDRSIHSGSDRGTSPSYSLMDETTPQDPDTKYDAPGRPSFIDPHDT